MVNTTDKESESTGETIYRGDLHIDEFSSCSTAVVQAIAAVKGIKPSDVDVHLYNHIHPEALNDLYRHADRTNAPWELEFPVDGFHVTLQSNGNIKLEEVPV